MGTVVLAARYRAKFSIEHPSSAPGRGTARTWGFVPGTGQSGLAGSGLDGSEPENAGPVRAWHDQAR